MTWVNDDKNDYLYRYQPFHRKDKANNNIVENLEIFSKKELFFVSPLDFNDPFDCKMLFTHKGCSCVDLYKFILNNTLRACQDRPNADIEKVARQRLHLIVDQEVSTGHSELDEVFCKYKEKYIEDIRGDANKGSSGIGVLSLSEKNDDILMWGHYADGHKGYCLEFEKKRLKEWTSLIPGKLAKVIYNDAYPNIADYMKYVDQGPGSNLDDLFLLRKSSHWGYEKEWRIIGNIDWQKANPQIYTFPEDMLTGIIFGCEMPAEHKNAIIDHLDSWTVKSRIYEADKSESQYALEIIKSMD